MTNRRLPLGFADFDQLGRFRDDLAQALERDDGGSALALVIGSSTTGWSMKEGMAPFSGESDIDVVLYSPKLLMKMMLAKGEPGPESFMGQYLWLRNDGPSGVLTVCGHLGKFAASWSKELGRPVDLRLLLQQPGGESRALDTMLDYGGDGGGGPIVLIGQAS